MHITVNGEPRDTGAVYVEELILGELGSVPAAGTAVAINGDVVPRSAWAMKKLPENAQVDILTAVQGG